MVNVVLTLIDLNKQTKTAFVDLRESFICSILSNVILSFFWFSLQPRKKTFPKLALKILPKKKKTIPRLDVHILFTTPIILFFFFYAFSLFFTFFHYSYTILFFWCPVIFLKCFYYKYTLIHYTYFFDVFKTFSLHLYYFGFLVSSHILKMYLT